MAKIWSCKNCKSKEHYLNAKGCKVCKPCQNARTRKWAKENPEHHAKLKQKNHKDMCKTDPDYIFRRWLKTKYNLSIKDYDAMLKKQDKKCYICGFKHKKDKRLFVDHCHESGEVRGLLCRWCSSGLGFFKDNIETMKAGIRYLRKHKAKT